MKIFWTKKSKYRFLEIEEYLNSEFGTSTADRFKNKVLRFLQFLAKFPHIGRLEVPDKEIYGFQITKQTPLFYRIQKDRITLLTFFDSRQNPERKPK